MNRAIVDDFSISAKPLKIMNYIIAKYEKIEKKRFNSKWEFWAYPIVD